jgi:hypothetical protein
MFIKLYYSEKIHKISRIPEAFEEFVVKVKAIFGEQHPCVMQYEDEEGDKIMMSDETDYKTMIANECHQRENQTIKVFVSVKKNQIKSCMRRGSGSSSPRGSKCVIFEDQIATVKPLEAVEEVQAPKVETKSEEKAVIATPTSESKTVTPTPVYNYKLGSIKKNNTSVQKKSLQVNPQQAFVVNDTFSEAGQKMALAKNSLVTIMRVLQNRGLVEIDSAGARAFFPAKDFQIVPPANSADDEDVSSSVSKVCKDHFAFECTEKHLIY